MARSGSISFRKIFGEEGRGLLAALFALPLVFYYVGGAVLPKIKEDTAEVRPDIIAERSITEEAEFTINFLKDKVISEVLSCSSADILGEEEEIPRTSELLTNEFASFLLHREQRLILPASYTPSRAGVPAFSPHF